MYYIIEHDIRPDGIVNTSETIRSTFASGLSYYYDRMSKMVMDTNFVSVHLLLTDDQLAVIKQDNVETQYKPAEVEE